MSAYTNVWAIGVTMLELLTLYRHAEVMNCPFSSRDGMIEDIGTVNEPEYSQLLRNLIIECIRPDPHMRIRLRDLRSSIKNYRKSARREYKEASEEERVRTRTQDRLYYAQGEDVPEGRWAPRADSRQDQANSAPRPEAERLSDQLPVIHTQIADGPENGIDDAAALPTVAPEDMQHPEDLQRQGTSP